MCCLHCRGERGIPFEAVYLGEGVTTSSVRAFAGAAKVPQVFLDKNTRETSHARGT